MQALICFLQILMERSKVFVVFEIFFNFRAYDFQFFHFFCATTKTVWDVAPGKLCTEFLAHSAGPVTSLFYEQATKILYSCGGDKKIRGWDVRFIFLSCVDLFSSKI